MKTRPKIRLWPIFVLAALTAALGVPLLLQPDSDDRSRTAMRSDCPQEKKKAEKRKDWGWDVFNGRSGEPVLYRL